MDAIYERINDDLEISDCVGQSEVQKYYAGKTVFLTGSTGYMGKCLIEKLLRGCPDLRRIYVLVRPRKGTSAEERIKKYLNDSLFGPLRDKCPDFESKIHLIEGDLIQSDMGLAEKDRETLIQEVELIFHNASNVKFNERVSNALKINVLGTEAMLNLAKLCKHIEGFLYVSTAYSHCYNTKIMEHPYPSPADMTMVRELIATDMAAPNGLNDETMSGIIGKFPNTYTYTKAIAEGLVNDANQQVPFPCIVYRPSIVMATWKEPLSGWCGNLNGPAMLMIGYGLGIIHAAIHAGNELDLVPVDMSINAAIVCLRDTVENGSNNSRSFVYNYGSSTVKPISVKKFKDHCYLPGEETIVTVHQLWHTFIVWTESVWHFALIHFTVHFIPAIIADLYLFVKGKKLRALSAFKRVTLAYKVLLYFVRSQWRIDITEMNKVVDRMSPIDRQLFFCDIREMDWADYCVGYTRGIRVYLLKDPMSTMPAATRKARTLKIVHYTVMSILTLLFIYVIATTFGLF